jgi:hypothetical protein
MIRWLWARMLKWGWDFNHDLQEDQMTVGSYGRQFEGDIELADPLTFRIQPVLGGTLIETSYYHRKSEDRRSKLYVVTPDENLAVAVGKIVTMELLQK